MNYLMVLPVEFFRVSDNTVATESAFRDHLRLLRESLPNHITKLTIAAPSMAASVYESRGAYLSEINESDEQTYYVPLDPALCGRLAYWLRYLSANILTIWRQVGQASVVHAGPSLIYRPREILAIIFAVLRRKKSIFVVDIDWRRSAWMRWKTGGLSFKSYAIAKVLYNPAMSLQVHLASRLCSLVLLKGQKLVDDYGRSRVNVKNILDAAHSDSHVISAEVLESKVDGLKSEGPLRLVYFGRLTGYKGIDHMIDIVASINSRNGPKVSLDIIGTGEDLAQLQQRARKAKVEDVVSFHAPISFGPELFEKLREYDLLLAAPLAADTPRNALDAMAAGLPVLAYDTDYYVDLGRASGAVGVVPWLDDDAYAAALMDLHHDRQRLADMTRSAVRFARSNTQEIWLETRAAWTREFCIAPRQAG